MSRSRNLRNLVQVRTISDPFSTHHSTDTIGGRNTQDLHRFSLRARSSIQASLQGGGRAHLVLLDRNSRVILNGSKRLNVSLEAGNYVLRVQSRDRNSTRYRLQLLANVIPNPVPPDAPPLPIPPSAPPPAIGEIIPTPQPIPTPSPSPVPQPTPMPQPSPSPDPNVAAIDHDFGTIAAGQQFNYWYANHLTSPKNSYLLKLHFTGMGDAKLNLGRLTGTAEISLFHDRNADGIDQVSERIGVVA